MKSRCKERRYCVQILIIITIISILPFVCSFSFHRHGTCCCIHWYTLHFLPILFSYSSVSITIEIASFFAASSSTYHSVIYSGVTAAQTLEIAVINALVSILIYGHFRN